MVRDKVLAALLWSAAIALAAAAAWVLRREATTTRDDDSMVVRKFAVLEERIRDLEADREADLARIAELEAGGRAAPQLPVLMETEAPVPEPPRAGFEAGINHSRELLAGVSLRITATDVARQTFGGLLTTRSGRVLAFRDQRIQQPIPLPGKNRMVATRVTRYSVLGYTTSQ